VPRPIILGVVGDSATGKTTLSRGLVRMLGENNVTHVAADDYHRYDRRQRAEHQITPLHPDCNYVDIMERHFAELRQGNAILKPVYQHKDGTFGPPVYTKPAQFTLIEGLLGYHTPELRESYDVRVFLAPPEELRRAWKVQRDCSRRGYTTDQVLEELDRREPDSELFIRPQQRWADLVVSFKPGSRGDQEHLDAEIVLRKGLLHPDLTEFAEDGGKGVTVDESDTEHRLFVPGDIDPALGSALRVAPALRAPRRVHGRYGAAPLRIARDRPGPRPVPPRHGARHGRARRRGHAHRSGGARGSGAGAIHAVAPARTKRTS